MLLTARMLKDVQTVNSFESSSQIQWTEGDALNLHFQLVDGSLDTETSTFRPAGRRFVPAAGATLTVDLENIDDAKKLTRLASQPFAQDGSIWRLQVLAADKIRGSPQLRLTLNEGGVITRGLLKMAIQIYPKSNLSVFP